MNWYALPPSFKKTKVVKEIMSILKHGILSQVTAGYSAEYQAVYDAFLVTPSDSDAEAQNTYVQTGLDDEWWGVEDREFIHSSHAAGRDSLLDWLDPTNDAKLATIFNASISKPESVSSRIANFGSSMAI